ncbi:uncharacterized protein E0L32_011743 [Thyridium curvatum]|uniref:Polyketide synthase n=1 Tax=Thyridium curvatum TaxID=1093900 RepID=A0A507BNK3_9PEZI|nr:uncharacterized protein E0L32_011743 [Thyridium curvatum]TPX18368.1 hypothetical protein E0L32_011743 [Thyridium curvatum]
MEPIAVVGIAHRFPGGASTPAAFWDLLQHPPDNLSRPPPPERLNLSKFYHPNDDQHGSTPVSKSYFLNEDVTVFDAPFFAISPLEAEAMDPQQRILLETVYEASESAGIPLQRLRGSQCSVFVGVMTADYEHIQYRDPEDLSTYTATGTSRAVLANRISYFFDLRGQSTVIDTACSSSLVALHLAVQEMRAGNSDMAVVSGCNLLLGPDLYVSEAKLHMLSPTGTCKMWDAGADGYARGEGVASLILKPLKDAIRDGDPIQGLVRHTGVNSDGRTQGITMPSAAAQASLIRHTYQAAGLDPFKTGDRCQYFEAHGTGTKAGDPNEAQGISEAFFRDSGDSSGDSPLLVGSVKTVIGHLEGCAGLAGVIKALLAMKHGSIPPNIHLKNLSPDVAPFAKRLRIPTRPMPWPSPQPGHPKRASINSFGFGGTNSHVILESYHENTETRSEVSGNKDQTPWTIPLLLSAHSKSSLARRAGQLAEFFRQRDGIDLQDIAWTLWERRSQLPYHHVFTESSREALLWALDHVSQEASPSILTLRSLVSPEEGFGALGIFTGQGAQWPGMGRELLYSSHVFRETIDRCERALLSLPDGPGWSLAEQLRDASPTSPISDAEIAQPATTAVEIGLVEILASSGVRFSAVVGHSSGEMAACYAAGILRLEDAIRIAYYRGLFAKKRVGKGAMLAAALAPEEAVDLCRSARFRGRLWLAAKNAPSTVTMSGDEDAVYEAKALLDDQKTFARVLRTDKAYHSPHMAACSDAYLQALQKCRIQPRKPRKSCIWVSSVDGHAERSWEGDVDALRDKYWIDNMLQPVLFTEAVTSALTNGGPFDVAVEVGPHPALKGPFSQTVAPHLKGGIPYHGCMKRGENSIASLLDLVGYLAASFGTSTIDLEGYQKNWTPATESSRRVIHDLPSYPWDHDKKYWRESRISRNHRLRSDDNNSTLKLLGRRCADDSDRELRWRNFLNLKELPWLRGHSFQGEALFPAAGHLSLMLEAAQVLTRGRAVKSIEVQNVRLERTLNVHDGLRPVEILCSAKIVEDSHEELRLVADFSCYFCSDPSTASTERTSAGTLDIHFLGNEEQAANVLPSRVSHRASTSTIDIGRFYTSMRGVGLEYDGAFKAIKSMHRTAGFANAKASWSLDEVGGGHGDGNLYHPAILDTALHPIFAAFTTPSTDRLWTAYLPLSIDIVRFVPTANVPKSLTTSVDILIDAHISESSPTRIVGDVDVFTPENVPLVQIQGVTLGALERTRASNDRDIFSQTVWKPDIFGGEEFAIDYNPPQDEMVMDAERVGLFYARKIIHQGEAIGESRLKWWEQRMLQTLRSHVSSSTAWDNDDNSTIEALVARHHEQVDFHLMHKVAREVDSVFRNEKQMVEVLFEAQEMNEFYRQGLGLRNAQRQIASYLMSITHRYPAAAVLELGAGTGATTSIVLDTIGSAFGSYTFTDVSAGFFPQAQEMFREHADRMAFRKLDISTPFEEQGFKDGAYDVVIAANVLHVTEDVEVVLRRVRGLLKPGGFLVVTEPTASMLRLHVILGGLEGWWLARDNCRVAGPILTCEMWDEKLQKTGFSGIDLFSHDQASEDLHSCTSFVSQATNSDIDCIRDPLTNLDKLPRSSHITIVGGSVLATSKLVRSIQTRLSSHGLRIVHYKDAKQANVSRGMPFGYVLYLSELDRPTFHDSFTDETLKGLQMLLKSPNAFLAVTKEASTLNPASNMMAGLFRGLRAETPSLQLQTLELEQSRMDADIIMTHFLRLIFATLQIDESSRNLSATETELRLRDDILFIPRVVPEPERNERYNSCRRSVQRLASGRTHLIQINEVDGKAEVTATSRFGGCDGSLKTIKVHYSTLAPVGCVTESQPQYICVGTNAVDSSKLLLALSTKNASEIQSRADNVYPIPHGTFDPQCLTIMAISVAVRSWLQRLPPKRTIWLHGLDILAVRGFEEEAARKDIRVFSTSRNPEHRNFLHPRAAVRTIKSIIPNDTIALVVSGPAHGNQEFIESVRTKLGLSAALCGTLFDSTSSQSVSSPRDTLAELYQSAATWQLPSDTTNPYAVIPVSDINSQLPPGKSIAILDWTVSSSVLASIKPIPAEELFKCDGTYFLVGLTGEVGLSICSWMVAHGVRNVALASRNPKIDPYFLESMDKLGATIRVFAMDVTSPASVQEVVREIKALMPPVLGVCNGSMVLADGLFQEMNKEHMETALKPKVQGSIILDQAFADQQLDFFIMLSSLGSVIGTPGQSNYHMANMFMVALAEQRRRKGLSGSVIDVGYIADIGYVPRQDVSVERTLRAMHMLALWEEEIHVMFYEAILAGQPDSGQSPELIIGLPVSNDESKRPHWASEPRFSHLVVESKQSMAAVNASSSALQSLHSALESLTSDEALAVEIQRAFSEQLESLLQLSSGGADMNSPLVSLGMDSLLAMEVQRWFRKVVGAEVSVLQILGGASGETICHAAAVSVFARRRVDVNMHKEQRHELENSDPQVDIHDDSTLSNGTSAAGVSKAAASKLGSPTESPILGIETPATSTNGSELLEREHTIGIEKEAPLSVSQARLWFLQKFLENPTTYNETAMYHIHGFLDAEKLRSAFKHLISHHEALRTKFYDSAETGSPVQAVLTESNCPFRYVDESGKTSAGAEFETMASQSWNLEHGTCLGATLIQHSSEHHTLIMGSHHIAVDGVSWLVMMRHLDLAYQSKALPPVLGYSEFAVRQQEQLRNGSFADEINFWKQELSGLEEPIPLFPMARVNMRPASNRYDSVNAGTLLDTETVLKVRQTSSRLDMTPFHFHLGILMALTARLSESEDICIGMVVPGRSDEAFAETVGFFINIIPVRVSVTHEDTFQTLCKKVSSKIFASLSNSRVPLDALLDTFKVARTARHSPVFQVIINYRRNVLGHSSIGDCSVKYIKSASSGNPYDICLNITETPSKTCLVEISSRESLYSREAAQSILDCYRHILACVCQTPSSLVSRLQLWRQKEETDSELLALGRGRRVDLEWEETVTRRIAALAVQHPDAVAIEQQRLSLTYRQLMIQVDNLVVALEQSQVPKGADTYCCLLFQPTPEYIVSFLSVLKHSAVAVPLDTLNSRERMAIILDDCQPAIVLHHDQTTETAEWLQRTYPRVSLLNVSRHMNSRSERKVNDSSSSESPAAMIYTSGTTGTPKGAILTHSNYRDIIASTTNRMQIGFHGEVVLQQTALGFDMAIMQILLGLCNSNTVVVATETQRKDPCAIAELLCSHRVSCMIATPTEYALMFQYAAETLVQCKSLRVLGVGGELFSTHLASQFRQTFAHQIRVFNVYGPTETCINSNVGLVEHWRDDLDQVAVGPPLDNVSIYVLDEGQNPVPGGCTGEVFVAGCGVGQGYLRRPELTSSVFIKDPFAEAPDVAQGWTTMYRTGDKGFLRPDGTLVVLGRVSGDTQVKIRGIRIELEDIASNIVSVSRGRVSQAAVTVRGETQMIIGFVVMTSAKDTEMGTDFFDDLAASLPLPEYMKPAAIIPVERLPKTTNGKLDRDALSLIPLPQRSLTNTGPGDTSLSSLESGLRQVWIETLSPSTDTITIDSDFFRCGGNSTLLIPLRTKIERLFHVKMPLLQLFEASTLRAMAASIRGAKDAQSGGSNWEFWDDETRFDIPSNTELSISVRDRKLPTEPKVILMTGTNTLLGSQLLQLLIASPDVAQVHCVALSLEEQAGMATSSKTTLHTGSLRDPNLGLSTEMQQTIQSEVDIIIHAGADGSCLNNYSSISRQNVDSTKFLASLAIPRQIPIHYISSARVVLFTGQNEWPEASVAGHYPPSDQGREGFTTTKWASEMALESFHAQTKVPIAIHRTGYLMSEDADQMDIVNMIYKYSTELRAVPSLAKFYGYLDMSEVQSVAASMANSVLSQGPTPERVMYQHHTDNNAVPIHDFRLFMERKLGHPFKELALDAWVAEAEGAGLSPFLAEFLGVVAEKGEEARYPRLLKGSA